MERYDFPEDGGCCPNPDLIPCSEGEWVKWDDHQSEVQEAYAEMGLTEQTTVQSRLHERIVELETLVECQKKTIEELVHN